jgi:hypothetical protein
MRFFDYIFYRQYKYIRQSGKGEMWASWSAFCWVSTIVMLTIVGIASLAELITGNKIIEAFTDLPKLELYGYVIIFIFMVDLRWGSKRVYENIISRFDAQKVTKRQLTMRGVGVWAYIIIWTLIVVLNLIVIRHLALMTA